jgi:hypothetical protein
MRLALSAVRLASEWALENLGVRAVVAVVTGRNTLARLALADAADELTG